MRNENRVPRFISVVAIVLGCIDLVRGFLHTILLEYAATNIAGLDLTAHTASDQLQLMGAFGISNFVSGAFLILTGLFAPKVALIMLAVIPAAYLVGQLGIAANTSAYPPTQANWGGAGPMMVYLVICIVTFIAGVLVTRRRKAAAE